jgi:uncharacterized iron-regulated protein
MMKILLLSLLFSHSLHAEITQIFDTKTNSAISSKDFLSKTQNAGFVVLGEFHNTPSIQEAEAQIITDVSNSRSNKTSTAVMWEFLNYTDQTQTSTEFEKFNQGLITSQEFLTNTAGKQNLEYAPVIEATKKTKATLIGLNLPRDLKQKVIAGGIGAIDPSYIPASHYVGGDQYLERFKVAMGEHIPSSKLPNYFLAQCLTDSVMANEAFKNEKDLNFIVAGSFHTEYFDATVARLKKLTNLSAVTVKIIDTKTATADEIKDYTSGDKTYGTYADFIIFSK